MVKIPVWPVKLKRRKKMLFLGGQGQSKARAMFIFLLPRDGNMYTASQVVQHSFPYQDYPIDYRRNYRTLSQLAKSNLVAADNEKRRARYAETWFRVVSDDIWDWGCDFMTVLEDRISQIPLGKDVQFFVDLDTFEISQELIHPSPTIENVTVEPKVVSIDPLPENESQSAIAADIDLNRRNCILESILSHKKIALTIPLLATLLILMAPQISLRVNHDTPSPITLDLEKELLDFEDRYLVYEIKDLPNRKTEAYLRPTIQPKGKESKILSDSRPQYMVMFSHTLHEH